MTPNDSSMSWLGAEMGLDYLPLVDREHRRVIPYETVPGDHFRVPIVEEEEILVRKKLEEDPGANVLDGYCEHQIRYAEAVIEGRPWGWCWAWCWHTGMLLHSYPVPV